MPISATRRMITGGWGTPKIDTNQFGLYLPLWHPDIVASCGDITNGTGVISPSPTILAVGANTITATGAGTFIVRMPEGGTVASGTATITGSPVTIPAGIATSVTTGVTTGNFTCTVSNIIRSKDKNNHACTITEATWGEYGRTLDGSNDKISIPHSTPIDITTEDFTVLAWANLGSDITVFRAILWKQDIDEPYNGYYLRFNQTTGYFLGGIDNTTAGTREIADTTNHANTGWHLYGMTVDRDSATGMNLWVDISIVVTGNPTAFAGSLSTTQSLYIGMFRDGSSFPFLGTIGEVAFCKGRAFNQSDITNYYLSTKWRYQS